MNTRALLYCALLAQTGVLAASAIAATTYVVQPDSTGDFATIQLAINAAANGDTVTLGNGLFTGDGNRDIDYLGKAIVVRSQSGAPDSCVIDCQGSADEPHRGFWFHSGEDTTAVLAHVTIRGGAGVTRGGGCLVGDPGGNAPSSPRIFGCRFEGNQAGTGAGAAVVNVISLPRIDECRFAYNEGSGLSIGGDAKGCFITDCISEHNTGDGIQTDGAWTGCGSPLDFTRCALRSNDGAGLSHRSFYGRARLIDCTVADNDGWGVESFANQDNGVTITGGSVTGNGAGGVNTFASNFDSVTGCVIHDNRGPGLQTGWDVELTVTNCEITDNDGHGLSAVSAQGERSEPSRKSAVSIAGCTIRGNGQSGINYSRGLAFEFAIMGCVIEANGDDGISFVGHCDYVQCHLTVSGSTIALNLGNGLQYQTDVRGYLLNCIVSGNSGAAVLVGGVEIPMLYCCDLFGNGGGDWVGAVAPQLGTNGNFSGDPLFCSIDLPDLGLLPGSPCAPENNPDCGLVGALPVGCDPLAGACCSTDRSCQESREIDCGESGGAYLGNGTICAPNPCPQPTGACCLMAYCVAMTKSECEGYLGTYQGNGVVCVPRYCWTSDVNGDDVGGEGSPLGSAPNPFRKSTEIHYRLAHEGPVTIEVFDASGRLVRRLLDAPRPRGAGSVTWDGRDEEGSEVPQGLFLVRVLTNGGIARHRVVLLK